MAEFDSSRLYAHQQVWYPIPSLEEYQISSEFNVRTCRPDMYAPWSKKPWRPVKVHHPAGKYPYFYARIDTPEGSRGITAPIHLAISEIIYGPVPWGLWILHYDDDKTNNYPSNLRYGTPTENAEDFKRNRSKRNGFAYRITTGLQGDDTDKPCRTRGPRVGGQKSTDSA